MQPQIAAMPRWLLLKGDSRKSLGGSPRTGGSAAGHAHVAGKRRALVASIDDEVMALGLAGDGLVDGCVQQLIAFRSAQRRAQIGGILLTEAHIERAGAGDADPVAGFAEVMRHRRDEA